MRRWLILAGMVIVLLAGAFFLLSYVGVRLIKSQLQKVTGPGLTIEAIKIRPTHLALAGVRYEDPASHEGMLQVQEMRIYPSLLSSLRGRVGIREWRLIQPSFFFFRSRDGVWTGPWPPQGQGKEGKPTEGPDNRAGKQEGSLSVKIDRVRIKDGTLHIKDEKTGGAPAQFHFKNLDLNLEEVQYPLSSSHSPLELKGRLKGPTREGSVYAKGWIDLKTIDMDTSLILKEIEVKTFEPYYRKRVSAEINSGVSNMDAKIQVKNRRIDAPGELEFVDLRIGEGSETAGAVFYIPATTLVSLLKDRGNRIKVKFHVKGDMDDPTFNLQESFLTRVAVSLAEALGLPIRTVGEETLGGVLKGAKGLTEGLKSIGDLFKKKKESGR